MPCFSCSIYEDSKYSWLICFASFLSWICTYGFQFSFGIIYSELLLEFNESRSKTAWVGSLATALMCMCSPLSISLGKRFGELKLMTAGALILTSSLLLSSFATSIDQLIASFGLLYGIGSACIAPLSQLLLQKVFHVRLASALGLCSAGASIGPLLFTPILEVCFTSYGWRGTLRIMAGMIAIIMLLSTFILRLIPDSENVERRERTASITKQLLSAVTHLPLIVFTLAQVILSLEYVISFTHQVQFAIESGIPKEKAAMLPTYMAISSTIGRTLIGFLFDLKFMDPLFLFQIIIYLTAITAFLGTLAQTYVQFLIYFLFLMFLDGSQSSQTLNICYHVVGPEMVYEGLGTILFFVGISVGVGPPLLGLIVDKTQDYSAIFYMTGTPLALGATILFILQCFRKRLAYLKKTQTKEGLGYEKCLQDKSALRADSDMMIQKVSVL